MGANVAPTFFLGAAAAPKCLTLFFSPPSQDESVADFAPLSGRK